MLGTAFLPVSYLGILSSVLIVVGGVGGVVAWLTGSSRKSLTDAASTAQAAQSAAIQAQKAEIDSLRDRLEVLEGEVEECRKRDADKAAVIQILMSHVAGDDRLDEALGILRRLEAMG